MELSDYNVLMNVRKPNLLANTSKRCEEFDQVCCVNYAVAIEICRAIVITFAIKEAALVVDTRVGIVIQGVWVSTAWDATLLNVEGC